MFHSVRFAICASAALLAGPSYGADWDDDTFGYVESNLLSIFYHELGHALIDIMQLPVFGQEEDAADVLSVILIDGFFEEDSAVQIAYDSAFGFLGEATNTEEPVFWGVHGPDLQRYFNLVCLFYGANPDAREDVAWDLGLPEERGETCAEEFELADASWGPVLDEIAEYAPGQSFVLGDVDASGVGGELTVEVVEEEIAALNESFELPEQLKVSVLPCGQANAFYDPDSREIIMCTEFADYLAATRPEL